MVELVVVLVAVFAVGIAVGLVTGAVMGTVRSRRIIDRQARRIAELEQLQPARRTTRNGRHEP